jgi:hypothetical protein
MARTRTIPDAQVLATVRHLLAQGGDKAISFGSVGRATKLAPSTLAQRYGTVTAMRSAALTDGWQVLTAATTTALDSVADKGPQGVLKALDALAPQVPMLLAASTDTALRQQATDWRVMVETALAQRLGGGDKTGERAREAAAILFAAWQGQAVWGGDGFRIKDAVKRLT